MIRAEHYPDQALSLNWERRGIIAYNFCGNIAPQAVTFLRCHIH
jgi:hypothetical protein